LNKSVLYRSASSVIAKRSKIKLFKIILKDFQIRSFAQSNLFQTIYFAKNSVSILFLITSTFCFNVRTSQIFCKSRAFGQQEIKYHKLALNLMKYMLLR